MSNEDLTYSALANRNPAASDDPANASIDPLKEQYRDAVASTRRIRSAMDEMRAALLCIDMQYLDAAEGIGVFAEPSKHGMPPESLEYYFDRLKYSVIPNIKRLQSAFRASELEVVHTRIQSLTRDGRDRSSGHKRLGLHAAPGSREAEFIEGIGPEGDEIVINKTASGVFNCTNIEYVLRNLGIRALFVCGVYSNECVSTAIRDACDRGFEVTMVHDACATVTPELQRATVTTMKDRYARILTTTQVVQEVSEVAQDHEGADAASTALPLQTGGPQAIS